MIKIILILITICPATLSFALEKDSFSTGQSLYAEKQAVPYQYIIVEFPFSSADIPENKQGTLSILAQVFSKGPIGLSDFDYQKQKFQLNTDIWFSTNATSFTGVIKFQKENLAASIALFLKVLNKPKLNTEVFEEKKQNFLNRQISVFDSPNQLISYFKNKIVLQGMSESFDGDSSPLTVGGIKLDDLKMAYSKIDINQASFFAFGPIRKAQVKKALENHLSQTVPSKITNKKLTPSLRGNPTNYLIHKSGATDNQLHLTSLLNLKPYTREYVVSKVAMGILGGGLNGRLAKELRVKKGLTYSAGSGISSVNKSQVMWSISTFGGIKEFPQLISAIPILVAKFTSKGVSAKELEESKKRLSTQFKQSFELPFDLFWFQTNAILKSYPQDYLEKFPKYLKSVTEADVNSFIKTSLDFSKMKVFALGDKIKIQKAIPNPLTVVEIEKIK